MSNLFSTFFTLTQTTGPGYMPVWSTSWRLLCQGSCTSCCNRRSNWKGSPCLQRSRRANSSYRRVTPALRHSWAAHFLTARRNWQLRQCQAPVSATGATAGGQQQLEALSWGRRRRCHASPTAKGHCHQAAGSTIRWILLERSGHSLK